MSSVHFPTDPFFSCVFLKISFPLPAFLSTSLPPPTFIVKVILIKSSHRTELLIALRLSSWFQIQIKAHRLFFFFSISSFLPALYSSSPLSLHVKYNLNNIHRVRHLGSPRSLLPLRTTGRKEGEYGIFSTLKGQLRQFEKMFFGKISLSFYLTCCP